MSVKIRLRRAGAKKHPTYRVVVADARSPRDGAFIETIGHYNPLTDPETVKINTDRARLWLQRGAQPTDAVARLLSKTGVTAAPAEAGESSPSPAQETEGETSEAPES